MVRRECFPNFVLRRKGKGSRRREGKESRGRRMEERRDEGNESKDGVRKQRAPEKEYEDGGRGRRNEARQGEGE